MALQLPFSVCRRVAWFYSGRGASLIKQEMDGCMAIAQERSKQVLWTILQQGPALVVTSITTIILYHYNGKKMHRPDIIS